MKFYNLFEMKLLKKDFDGLIDAEIEELERRRKGSKYSGKIVSVEKIRKGDRDYVLFHLKLRRRCTLKYLDPVMIKKYGMPVHMYFSGGREKDAYFITEDRKAGILNVGETVFPQAPEDSTLGIQKMALDLFCEGENPFLDEVGLTLFMGKQPSKILNKNFVISGLNPYQEACVNNCVALGEKQFFLVQGPPGTGKTTTICKMVEESLKNDWKILVTSHTNIAIDNVFERLHVPMSVRFGNSIKTLSSVHDRLPPMDPEKNNMDIWDEYLERSQLVGATLSKMGTFLSCGLLDWVEPMFDLVIIDEASMSSFPLSLLGLLNGERFVLVGDHKQLSPILISNKRESVTGHKINPEVRKSLFEMLIERVKRNKITLPVQYRSNRLIADFISKEFYNGVVKTDVSAESKFLKTRSDKTIFSEITGPDPLIWIDTKSSSKGKWRRYGSGFSYCNPNEAAVCAKLFYHFVKNLKYRPKDIAIISPYRLQTDLIKETVHLAFGLEDLESFQAIDVNTVHAFQGRQNKVVMYNLVLDKLVFGTKDRFKIFNDNLFNVALSRAEFKLIMVANSETADESELPRVAHLYNHMKKNGIVFDAEKTGEKFKDVDEKIKEASKILFSKRWTKEIKNAEKRTA